MARKALDRSTPTEGSPNNGERGGASAGDHPDPWVDDRGASTVGFGNYEPKTWLGELWMSSSST